MTYTGEFEERLAAQWAGYQYREEFKQLDGDEQAAIIATYRGSHVIEGVLSHRSQSKTKPGGKKP